jgi:hypothetical protein
MQTVTKKRANSVYRNYRKTATKRIPTDFFNQVGYFSQLLDARCRLECRVILPTEEGAIDLGSVAFDALGYSESDEALSLIKKIENLEMLGSIATPHEILDLSELVDELAHPDCMGVTELLSPAADSVLDEGTSEEDLSQSSMMAIDLSESLAAVGFPVKAVTLKTVKTEVRLKILKLCLALVNGL